jgi:hypothetical protein
MAELENFGKADPHILKVYEMVCDWRVQDSIEFMDRHYANKAQKEKSKGICKKLAQWVSRLFIIVVVLYMVAPQISEFYEEQIVGGSDSGTVGKGPKGKKRQ